jgi:membrane protease YdiL (CAAX protease family)
MQFFGFVPRMMLGALFGYLYAWSGSLSISMLAHFVNNAFGLAVMYLHQLGQLDIDLESTEAEPWPVVLAFAAVTGLVLFRFRKIFQASRPVPGA